MKEIELDLYKEVTVIIRYESGRETTERHDLRDAIQLWEDARTGLTGMLNVRILYPIE